MTKQMKTRELIKNSDNGRKPEWLRKKLQFGAQKEMDQLLNDVGIHTICAIIMIIPTSKVCLFLIISFLI